MQFKPFYFLFSLVSILISCQNNTAEKFQSLSYNRTLTDNIWIFDHAEGRNSALGAIDPVELGFMDKQIIIDFNNTGKLNIHNSNKEGEIVNDQYNGSYYFTGDTLAFSNASYNCLVRFASNEQMMIEFKSKDDPSIRYNLFFIPFSRNKKMPTLDIHDSEWRTINLSSDSGRIWFYESDHGKRYAQLILKDSTTSLLEGRYSVINYKGLQLVRIIPIDDAFKEYSLYCYEADPDKIRFECSSGSGTFPCDLKRLSIIEKNLIRMNEKWSSSSHPDKILFFDSTNNKYMQITRWDTILGNWSISPQSSFVKLDHTIYHAIWNEKEVTLTSSRGNLMTFTRN